MRPELLLETAFAGRLLVTGAPRGEDGYEPLGPLVRVRICCWVEQGSVGDRPHASLQLA